jgi:adenylyl- and sulfurtransferase ThiI
MHTGTNDGEASLNIKSNEIQAAQRDAGTKGRNRGHKFEQQLAEDISALSSPAEFPITGPRHHLVEGDPAEELLRHIVQSLGIEVISSVKAWWTGGLATS